MDKVVVIGSLNMDFAIEVKEMPKVGETILGKNVSLIPGGKGANQAYAIGKLGKKVRMVGAVGNDLFGGKLIDNLENTGVDTKGTQVLEGVPSGQAFINVNEAGENSIVVIPGANQKLDKKWIDHNLKSIADCDAVVMQLEIPMEVVVYAAKVAKEQGKMVFLDPAPAVPELPEELLQNVHMIKPNRTELATLTGCPTETREEVIEAARKMIDKGVKMVLVTLGGDGCMLVSEEKVQEFQAERVEVVDTTAAGDSFTAGFVAALQDENYEEAIAFATQVSAISVTRKGAQTSIPTLEEVLERIENKKKEGENE